jgi:hypothetical protein
MTMAERVDLVLMAGGRIGTKRVVVELLGDSSFEMPSRPGAALARTGKEIDQLIRRPR